jgi:hypothetical protein
VTSHDDAMQAKSSRDPARCPGTRCLISSNAHNVSESKPPANYKTINKTMLEQQPGSKDTKNTKKEVFRFFIDTITNKLVYMHHQCITFFRNFYNHFIFTYYLWNIDMDTDAGHDIDTQNHNNNLRKWKWLNVSTHFSFILVPYTTHIFNSKCWCRYLAY